MAKVLIIGGGGREHALAWALARSPQVEQIYVTPGNGGTLWAADGNKGIHASSQNIALDLSQAAHWARANAIDLTVVGPEAPLAAGIVDEFQAEGLRIFGPTQHAAQIEASKAFAKDLMTQQGIPTGEYFVADDYLQARHFLGEFKHPVVVKADGLAAGKGVIMTDSAQEAGKAIHKIMQEKAFGNAGDVIILEERLQGREISVLAFSDGKTVKPMLLARDHKRALDGDRGLNTGGMGAIAPTDDIDAAFVQEVVDTVLQPAVDGLNALGTPYVGVLYAGLMLTDKGLRTLEFNCRFGDPEAQVILPLLKTDLYDILQACLDGTLDQVDIEWHDGYATTVVLASPGYPESYPKGLVITGADIVGQTGDILVFHAGTTHNDAGDLVTNGGRVMAVTARGATLDEALKRTYDGVYAIHFDGMHYRKDIGRT